MLATRRSGLGCTSAVCVPRLLRGLSRCACGIDQCVCVCVGGWVCLCSCFCTFRSPPDGGRADAHGGQCISLLRYKTPVVTRTGTPMLTCSAWQTRNTKAALCVCVHWVFSPNSLPARESCCVRLRVVVAPVRPPRAAPACRRQTDSLGRRTRRREGRRLRCPATTAKRQPPPARASPPP